MRQSISFAAKQNKCIMTAEKSTAKYWLYTFVWLGVVLLFLMFIPEWFWVPLPFFLTNLVVAFDSM